MLRAAQLRKLAWNGVPDDLRPLVWPLLLVSSPTTVGYPIVHHLGRAIFHTLSCSMRNVAEAGRTTSLPSPDLTMHHVIIRHLHYVRLSDVHSRATFLFQNLPAPPQLHENEENTPRLLKRRLRAVATGSTSRSGTRSRSMFPGQDQESCCGCRVRHNE